MNETILKIDNMFKSFSGVYALKGVNFELKRGEVHALIGENGAGKSTLMKILLGEITFDSGLIQYKGQEIHFQNPSQAINNGICMIHQETSLIASMSVAENIWLGREHLFTKAGVISSSAREKKTAKLLSEYGIKVDPQKKISELNVANMQLVELARALSYNSEVIIMDEPTSSLTESEIQLLYRKIRDVSARGVSVVFISHKLEEIFEICDRVTVLRDGQYICTKQVNEITQNELVEYIIGRKLEDMFVKGKTECGDTVLKVEHLSSNGKFYDVSFDVKAGEIVGFFGLLGAGRTEVMRAIFGIDRFNSGAVYVNGEKMHIRQPKEAVKYGLGMITEDRLRLGAIYKLSVMANATLSNFRKVCNRLGFVKTTKEMEMFNSVSGKLKIKYDSPKEYINQLSGGNQQKVIIARWLLTNPKVLILDEPTRGIDVGAKSEIYKIVSTLAAQGVAVVLVTSEMGELLSLSDRIMVMREGKLVYNRPGQGATQEEIISYAFGVKES